MLASRDLSLLLLSAASVAACGNSSTTAASSTSSSQSVAASSGAARAPSGSAAPLAVAEGPKPGADFKPHKLPAKAASGEHGVMVEQAPSKSAGKVPVGEFAGEYTSTFGGTATVAQDDTSVTITYDKGAATCVAGGDVLECDWKQPDKSGRAVFIKTSTGMLTGTYGNDESNGDKGAWAFIPTSSLEEKPENANFEGTYESSFGGVASIAGEGDAVTLTYKNGKGDCVARGDVLNCAWTQATRSGHAIFRMNDNGSLYGSWGKGERYSNGGPWTLTRKEEEPPSDPPAPPPPQKAPPPPPPSTGYAADGLPVDIPSTGSKPPSVSEWASVTREVTVWGSSALSCETKMLREWLRVSCRATGTSTPVDVATSVAGGQQAYMGMYGTTASLVVQVVRNRHYEAAFAWQENNTADFYGATLVVDWTGGAQRPTLKFQ